MAELDDVQLCSIVAVLVKDAEEYRDERSEDRIKAMAFFDGDADDLNKPGYIEFEPDRSRVVSRDVRSAVKKVLPSIYRTILGNDQIVEYQPVGQGDEDSAEQATDYVNYVVLPECDGRQAVEDAINDAVRLRNGILKWWQEEVTDVKTSLHTGLDEMAFAQLVEGDDVEVVEHTQRMEIVEVPGEDGIPVPTEIPAHDVKIKRRVTTSGPKIAAIPLENWLIHPDAIRLEDSPILGEKCKLRRSDLVKMGYDKDEIWAIPSASSDDTDQEYEADLRRREIEQNQDAPQKALDELDYYDLLVRVDKDGDGIAELRRMVFAGGVKAEHLLEDTEWDEVNYADIVAERRPHQWEGNSVPDDCIEIQRVKTVLLRQTLDNIYWQNNLQPIVQEGVLVDPSAVLNPKFGLPIRVSQGTDVKAAIGYNIVPLVADKSFAMLSYLDEEMTDRTGISDASSGMAPDALQNMTAKASAMVEAAGIGQTEMMVRCIANCLKPVFRGLLKLIIQHQDKPRTVRLRDEWVTFDPRMWDANMDAVVNVGLGAGTRERDMMAMQQVIGLQERILERMGPAVGMKYVSPQNFYNSIAKLTEAAGLKSVNLYFTEPDPDEIQQLIEQQAQQPSPEEIKAKAAMELEQVRGQTKIQVEQGKVAAKMVEFRAKMEADASKEQAQMDADLATKLQEIEAEAIARMEEAVLRANTDREQQDVDIEREAMKQQTEREWMQTQREIAAARMVADVQKAQAASVGKAMDRQRQSEGNRQGRNGR
jgi:hypothetical protein